MICTNLRCEHVAEPLAIETPRPRFSWNNTVDRRGARQSAYQIVVSRELASVRDGVGTEWDSGKVASEEQAGIEYAGKALESFTRYYYSVRTWDDKGAEGGFDSIATFETGAFEESDWSAKWITRREAKGAKAGVRKVAEATNKSTDLSSQHVWGLYFAKGFVVEGEIRRARAYVTGLGYYELEINGRKVGDHLLDPGQTDYASGALYVAHDIDGLLEDGENVVVLSLANGRHIDAYGYSNPRGIVQLLIELADGTRRTIGSDESWLFGYGPVHENGIYLGELYDARDEERLDALRTAAREAAASRSSGAAGRAGGIETEARETAEEADPVALRAQIMPPIRATHELQAVSMTNPAPGSYVFDFGQNLAGVVRLRVEGPRGTEVVLRYAELVEEEDGDLHLGTNREAPASDTYILKGEGAEVFQPRFTYHGFRYVRITGYPGTPQRECVRAVAVHTDVEQTGSFACSNPLINKIHENTLWSQRSNLMSVPTDCPQRGERMGWLGDAQLASEQAMCNFDMAAFYVKYLDDISLSQKADGSLSDVTPAYWPLFPADPAWATAYVTLVWHLYYSYGDRHVLETHYEAMKRYIEYLTTQSDGHIIRGLGKYGDWCPPGSIFPKQTPIELTSTWYYYYDTRRFSEIARLLGRDEDAESYAERADAIREAFNGEFLKEDGRYATLQMSPIDRQPGQTSQALPLFLDIVPQEQHASAVDKLVKAITDRFDSHVDTGIVGTRYLFEVLRDEGYAELAYRMITQTTYPGWGYMIERGATTIWERWEDLRGLGMNSHNHIMLGSVDAWFYRTLAGIIQTAPNWRTATIAPHDPGDLTHASATVGTLYGELAVSWHRSGDDFTLDLEVPVGIEAEVRIPRGPAGESLLEGGKQLERPETVGDRYVVSVGSGSYHFERRLS